MNLSDYRTCRDLPTLTKTEIIDGKEKKAYHMGCWFPHPITKEGREHYLNEFQDILQKKGKNKYEREELFRQRNHLFIMAFQFCKRSKFNWELNEEEELLK